MLKGYVVTPLGPIHYRRTGKGEPVVLLAQSGRSSRMHLNLMRALAPQYDVIALDIPGSGESAPLAHGTSFEDIAGSLLAGIRALGVDSVNLYGIHTGNKIGAAMAVIAPGMVRRFVFAGQSHSIIPNQETRNDVIRRGVPDVVEGADNANANALRAWSARLAEINSFGLSKKTLSRIECGAGYEEALERIVDELQAMASRPALYASNFIYDLERDLRCITRPTLVLEIVTPNEDRTVGRQGAAVLALLRNGWLIELPAPDFHGITLEDRADELAQILANFFG